MVVVVRDQTKAQALGLPRDFLDPKLAAGFHDEYNVSRRLEETFRAEQ